MPRGNRKTRGRQLGGQMISLSEPERPSSQMEIDTPQIQPQSSQMAPPPPPLQSPNPPTESYTAPHVSQPLPDNSQTASQVFGSLAASQTVSRVHLSNTDLLELVNECMESADYYDASDTWWKALTERFQARIQKP